eukprot:4419451-Amphidinium_carterae.1
MKPDWDKLMKEWSKDHTTTCMQLLSGHPATKCSADKVAFRPSQTKIIGSLTCSSFSAEMHLPESRLLEIIKIHCQGASGSSFGRHFFNGPGDFADSPGSGYT